MLSAKDYTFKFYTCGKLGKIIESKLDGNLYHLTPKVAGRQYALKVVGMLDDGPGNNWREMFSDRANCIQCLGWVKQNESSRVWVYELNICKHK